jgi:hypothetical protein
LYISLSVVISLQQSAAQMLGHANLTASPDGKRSTSPDAPLDMNSPFDLILLYSMLAYRFVLEPTSRALGPYGPYSYEP